MFPRIRLALTGNLVSVSPLAGTALEGLESWQAGNRAQYELALMYELGLGVDQDTAEAARWYGLSSAQSCPSELSADGRLGGR